MYLHELYKCRPTGQAIQKRGFMGSESVSVMPLLSSRSKDLRWSSNGQGVSPDINSTRGYGEIVRQINRVSEAMEQ